MNSFMYAATVVVHTTVNLWIPLRGAFMGLQHPRHTTPRSREKHSIPQHDCQLRQSSMLEHGTLLHSSTSLDDL